MIKGLTGGPGVLVSGGNTALPYVNQNSSDSFSGLLRIWGNDIQYYTNGVWNTLPSSYASVTLDASADTAIKWAQAQMAKESSDKAARDYMKRRAAQFPSLQKALESIERAESIRDQEVKEAIENFHLLDKIAGEPVNDADMEVSAPMQSP